MDNPACNPTRLRISTGFDLEDLERWRRPLALLRRPERIFSADEIEWCLNRRDPIPHFAVRWCAREAVIKAMRPLVALRIFDVETQRRTDGSIAPALTRGRRWPAEMIDIDLSVSHSRTTVGAVATLLYKESPSA